MLNVSAPRMSLLCALLPLVTACVEAPGIAGVPSDGFGLGALDEPVDSEPAAFTPFTPDSRAPASAYVFPREASVHGKGHEEWAVDWWKWVLAIPRDENPQLGAPCDVDQPDHVFFLAANFGGTATRSCTVPKDKAIFFPILNAIQYNCPEFSGGGDACENATSADYIHDRAEMLLDLDNTMVLEIDGVSIDGLDDYRFHTDTFFPTAPEDAADRLMFCSGTIRDNPCGVPVGSPRNTVTDGHWVMLRPLPPGQHQIHFAAAVPSVSFSLDITYDIVVAP